MKQRVDNTRAFWLKGYELIFISRILRDGSAIVDVSQEDMSHLDMEDFTVTCLSITLQTYIASEMNSFVVKLRE
jgi:hypothetical protein